MTTYSPSSRTPQDRSSSLLPAIVVNPTRAGQEHVMDGTPARQAPPATPGEMLAAFLDALADGLRNGDVQPGDRRDPSASDAAGDASLGAARAVPGGYGDEASARVEGQVLAYHILSALRNLTPFVIITKGPRGPLVIAHLPKKTYVLILFALFLMFASIYRMPEVWEIMFGIIGIF